MVLSGFIFVYGTFGYPVRYGGFLLNHIPRIYPLYLLLVVLAACLHPERDAVWALVRYVLPLANFGPHVLGQMRAMGWAVAVEFQFYPVFPLLLTLLERHGPGLFWRMILLLVGLRSVLVLLGNDIQPLAYWTIGGRMDQFLIGMLAGRWFALRPVSAGRMGWQIMPCSVGIVLLLYGFNGRGAGLGLVYSCLPCGLGGTASRRGALIFGDRAD